MSQPRLAGSQLMVCPLAPPQRFKSTADYRRL
jgi:hypothetical protein